MSDTPHEIPCNITAPMIDNQTWNSCIYCNKSWKDKVATPGLLHRSVICAVCTKKVVKNGSSNT